MTGVCAAVVEDWQPTSQGWRRICWADGLALGFTARAQVTKSRDSLEIPAGKMSAGTAVAAAVLTAAKSPSAVSTKTGAGAFTGVNPTSSSYARTPKAHMSQAVPYARSVSCLLSSG
ncbi:hypothetical protein Vafri_15893 [Volvox africanus]|uniref:Uncharacterized protein n=1 Tax=Volvox africanus TaxID=51714 RepID=A0A8J4F5V4_9CHLO|nr:hypothetical protein Vafri_15893 [Volvox africanus]